MVGAGHSAYTDRFYELARLVPHLVTPETKRIERNGSLKKSGERRGDGKESSKERNVMGDNKRARTWKLFDTITNPVRKEYTGSALRCTNCNFHHNPEMPCRMCTNYNRLGHFAKDYRAGPRMVNQLNARNSIAARGACYECGGTDYYKSACPRLNRAPRQGGNRLNQAMAIEGGQGCGNNGNTARMDWLSRYRAKIVCHERVVLIPLPHGEILRVFGERPEEKVKRLMSAKAEEPKLEDIAIIRNFSEVFPDDLSGLPPSQEVEFCIDLIPGAMPVTKSPYRSALTEMEELSNQLKEL
ncbi:hypothetical protein Tco_1048128 [Tanacetum coccineum]